MIKPVQQSANVNNSSNLFKNLMLSIMFKYN